MAAISIEYLGDLQSRAVHNSSGTELIMDAPADIQGKGSSFSPTDLVATALGGCILTVMGIVARNYGIDISGTTVDVSKELTASGVRRFARLETTVKIPHDLDAADRRRLERGAHSCPVHHSLHPDIEAPITFIYGKG